MDRRDYLGASKYVRCVYNNCTWLQSNEPIWASSLERTKPGHAVLFCNFSSPFSSYTPETFLFYILSRQGLVQAIWHFLFSLCGDTPSIFLLIVSLSSGEPDSDEKKNFPGDWSFVNGTAGVCWLYSSWKLRRERRRDEALAKGFWLWWHTSVPVWNAEKSRCFQQRGCMFVYCVAAELSCRVS